MAFSGFPSSEEQLRRRTFSTLSNSKVFHKWTEKFCKLWAWTGKLFLVSRCQCFTSELCGTFRRNHLLILIQLTMSGSAPANKTPYWHQLHGILTLVQAQFQMDDREEPGWCNALLQLQKDTHWVFCVNAAWFRLHNCILQGSKSLTGMQRIGLGSSMCLHWRGLIHKHAGTFLPS